MDISADMSRHLLFGLLLAAVATGQSTVIRKELPIAPKPELAQCSGITNAGRYDCYPEDGATEQACQARGCCWVPAEPRLPPLSAPWCFFPTDYAGYKFTNVSNNGQQAFMERQFQSGYPRDVRTLKIDVENRNDNVVRIKISDAENNRYESLYPKISNATKQAKAPSYTVELNQASNRIEVRRAGSGKILFTTAGGLVFADQFLQISSPFSGNIYGLGEHRTTFWHDKDWTRLTLWNHDMPPIEEYNLYGSHPFYLIIEPDGSSYGVFLRNSNGMDVLIQPLPAVTFRPIGGILDLFIFTGPTPADVISQYTELIGRPALVPYWALGFQQCKYGYGTLESTRAAWQRTRDAGIPFDVQWNDIDYMITQNDFTIDPVNFAGLSGFVDEIHAAGMHYVPILDPGVSAAEPAGSYPPYDDGLEMDIFIKRHDNNVFIGKVWNPVSTAFPDFTHPRIEEYWGKQVRELHDRIKFDGLWIDMNEPSNFLNGAVDGCPQDELEYPQYTPGVDGTILAYKTVCSTAKQAAGRHYDLHNLYGIAEAEVTQKVLRDIIKKRPFVLSRSTFPGSGAYTGHWSGDNLSAWHDLTKSVPELLTFSLFGIPFMGADICGFRENSWESLCNRWMQLGAFYPFSRNHNSINTRDQDPAAFGELVIRSSKKALTIRYTLLPYLYTLLYESLTLGTTVARPLFFEFPEDVNTHQVDRSFLWGSAFYIIPVTEDQSTSVETYLPAGKWYDYYTRNSRQSSGSSVTLDAPIDTIPLLIRGGYVMPTQEPGITTTLSRKNPFGFLVALDDNGSAKGTAYWDDGETVDAEKTQYGYLSISVANKQLTTTINNWTTTDTPTVSTIEILGAGSVSSVTVNGQSATFKVTGESLLVSGLSIPLSDAITLTWE